jgi:hypothetical protein
MLLVGMKMQRQSLGFGLGCVLMLACAADDGAAEDVTSVSSITTLDVTSGDGDPGDGDPGDGDADAGDGDGDDGDGDGDPDDGDPDDGGNIKFDLAEFPPGGDGDCAPNPDALLEGTVYAPNMVLPISGALVYVTSDPVEPIPDEVYCAECVELDCTTPFTLSGPDGSFTLPAVSGPGQKLVVHKGQFLRIVDLDIDPGMNAIPAAQSNLPGEWNPNAGMWIPRIAVYQTSPDAVYNVLAKFGLGQVANGILQANTQQFTLIDDNDQGAFMDDLVEMSQYHIIFLPCASTKYWVGAPNIPNSRIDNIRAYVEAGGKLYATDHSNEYIEGPFPAYQEFYNPGMPDIQPAYSSLGEVVEPDLLAWLDALPGPLKDIGGGYPNLLQLPNITTQLNYSGIESTPEVLVEDDMGQDVNVGHRTWVEGPCQSCGNAPQNIRPMAISGQYGCGRMMYSTFETSSSAHAGLSPQELVLLYMILEITTCFDGTPPPPPAN